MPQLANTVRITQRKLQQSEKKGNKGTSAEKGKWLCCNANQTCRCCVGNSTRVCDALTHTHTHAHTHDYHSGAAGEAQGRRRQV